MQSAYRVEPVTNSRWEAFEALMGGEGCPNYCYCMLYRAKNANEMSNFDKKEAMKERVGASIPIGVLAFDGDEPVGWCSVAPRDSYAKLENSRTMPKVDDLTTWTVLCLFVKRSHREKGITHDLLRGAVRYARAGGAQVIEAYPFDTNHISSTHRGHSSMYRAAGFVQQGNRWVIGKSGPGLRGARPARERTS